MRTFLLLRISLTLFLLHVVPAYGEDPSQSYQREMDNAIAAINKQSQNGSMITMPVLRSTGSAMYDKAAQVTIQFTVDLRRERAKANWKGMFFDGSQEENYSFLAEPKLVEEKYLKLENWRVEQRRHLAVIEQIVFSFQKGMIEVHAQYGDEAKVFSSPYVDEMAVYYPLSINKVTDTLARLIEYAQLNAGKIKPSPNGLVTMQTKDETIKILMLIMEVEESIDQAHNLAG